MPTIAIDARLSGYHPRGWCRYTLGLLEHFPTSSEFDFKVLVAKQGAAYGRLCRLVAQRTDIELVAIDFHAPVPDEFWKGGEREMPECYVGSFDLLHSLTRFVPPTRSPCVVATVHDIIPLAKPGFKQHYKRATLQALRSLCEYESSLIAVSEFTKAELVSLVGYDATKISVIHEGVGSPFASRIKYPGVRAPLLYVGAVDPNKNFDCLLKAFRCGRRAWGRSLVLAGHAAWGYEHFRRDLEELGDDVQYYRYADDLVLAELYQAAEIVVVTSFYEGFGLPLVEAMASGTPLVVADIPVFREIAGDAARYFNPYSARDLEQVISELLRSEEQLGMLSRLGLERSKRFSWESAATQTLEIYRRQLGLDASKNEGAPLSRQRI